MISDGLLEEIAFMMVRMCDYLEFSLQERESIKKEREELALLKEEKEKLSAVVEGFNSSMQ